MNKPKPKKRARILDWIIAILAVWTIVVIGVVIDALDKVSPDAAFWLKWATISAFILAGIVWFREECRRDHEKKMEELARKERGDWR